MIKESIEEGKALEHMELGELNNYIDKKINKYKENNRLYRDIKGIEGKEDKIIPLIMKNNLPMNLKEIKEINSLLNGEKNVVNIVKNILNPENTNYKEDFKEGIRLLQEKISQSIKTGDSNFKENYDELINSLGNQDNPSNPNNRDNLKEEYVESISKISKKDMVIQLPVQIGEEYKNLNLIVPNIDKGIDKNNMSFYIELDTDNLGNVSMEIDVRGKEVSIYIEEKETSLRDNISLLKESLGSLGYSMTIDNRQVVL